MTPSDKRIKEAFDAIVALGDSRLQTRRVQKIYAELDTKERSEVRTLLAAMKDTENVTDLSLFAASKIGMLAEGLLEPKRVFDKGTVLDNSAEFFRYHNPPLPPFEIDCLFSSGGQAQLYKARSLAPVVGSYVNPNPVILKVIEGAPETVFMEATFFHMALLLNRMTDTDLHPSCYGDMEKDVMFYAMPEYDLDLEALAKA